jgi:peroxiredoxin
VPQIIEAGARLVVISPQLEKQNQEVKKQAKLTFEILSDVGHKVAEQFGLAFEVPDYLRGFYRKFGADLEQFNGDNSWRLPMPARFIIDRNAIIRSVDADPDYTMRPEPSATVEALRNLAR